MDYQIVLLLFAICTRVAFCDTNGQDQFHQDLPKTMDSDQESLKENSKTKKKIELPKSMISLTSKTFPEFVMKSKEAWMVMFHMGTLPPTWISKAIDLEGIAWIGGVDMTKHADIADIIVSVVYIFGAFFLVVGTQCTTDDTVV